MCRHAVPTLRLRRPITATTQIHQEVQPTRTFILTSLSPIHWGDHCGPDDRDCHTQPRKTSVPKRVPTPLTSGCVPGPDIATQQRKHIGASPPYDEDTPDRRQDQRKEKEGGTSAKSSVLMLTCVPLPHLVLPLSGCACSSAPTKATRGEARGHP